MSTTSTGPVNLTDFAAKGKILSIDGRTVEFEPANFNYKLRLEAEGSFDGAPIGVTIPCLIRIQARKLWSVPSGGNFIDPIYGPPRRVQGRIKYLDEQKMVVHAGAPILVTLPTSGEGFDLPEGPLTVGKLVNVSALPGATIELVKK